MPQSTNIASWPEAKFKVYDMSDTDFINDTNGNCYYQIYVCV